MKKLFYLLFISSVLASCTKQEPAELTCSCDGANNGTSSSSSFVDPNLVGHWKVTGLTASEIDNWSGNTFYYWNNGQIDLHFFADGSWDIDANTKTGYYPSNTGTYKTHSNNCIDLGDRVLNYSITNGVLIFSDFTGQIDIRWVINEGGDIAFKTPAQFFNNDVEINNLVKQ